MITQQPDTDTPRPELPLDTTPRQLYTAPVAAPPSPPASANSQAISLTSSAPPKPLKINPDAPPEQLPDQDEVELPSEANRDSSETLSANEKPTDIASSQPTRPSLDALSDPEDHHTSPLDELLSPTTTSAKQTPSFVRDSVAGSDFGEVRLDDERFSTVSLNFATARGSTVAVKSPVHEKVQKPWEEEEPPLAPSEISNASVRASLLLQRLGNDATPPRRSLDGQHKLQEVFERVQRDSRDLEGELASVDWGEFAFSAIFVA